MLQILVYGPLVIPVGVVAECGHGLVRIGHVIAGDDPPDDLVAPAFMLTFGLVLLVVGARGWRQGAIRRSTTGGLS
jgi:hypothetical protein